MKIAFNPSTVAALTSPPDNKDITFDLRGHNIFARGVKFQGTDTNTWRDIKVNNVSIGSHTLDLRNGSNTTLTNTNGVVTINSTWRPVVDNLTSNSTTSSLSANQGRVLAGLINGKSDSDHNHDDRYVKRSGDTMLGALNFANGTWNLVGDDVYMGDHNIGGQLCIMGANGTTGLSFHKYGDASIRKSITFDGNTLYMNGSCDYATLSNQTNLLAINTVPNKTAATSIGSWSPISGRYVFHQKWTDTSTGDDTADFGIYLDGNLTANMVLDGYYNSLLGFRVIGATGGFLKANGTIDNSTYLTSHQSLSNYYTKGEIDNQLGKYKLKSSIWVPETKVIRSNFRDFLNKENLHKQAPEELNLYRFFAQNDESNYSSKYNYPVVDSHAMVFSIDGNNSYIRSMNFDLRSNDIYVTSRVAGGEWRNWVKLLDSSNYSGILDSRYYTESEINSLLDAKLNRQNLSYGTWNPRGYHLAADYQYNGGDLSISENSGQIHVSIDGYFWQNEGNYKVLDTSDVAGLKGNLTVHQYLSATDVTWWPLIWGGDSHNNTNDSTGAVYKSHDKLSWQTGSQTLYATNIQTENIRHLSIGGGIYWNPNVESASDGSDAASITLVKSGVAGGTTLVLSQMNDANDTIQFKTNAAARLYHNSYPILTIQNTYVSNGKGYINGTEITQVNNSDSTGSVHWNNVTNKPSSFTPSSHTHTWTSIADKIVAGNEFNIVHTGFKEDLWFNYVPINDRSKPATVKSYRFADGNRGYTSLVASGFIINGGTSQQLLRADGGVATFNWTGQSGQPTWLWGGNSQHSYYVYNPSNFRVAYAASAGNADTLDGEHASNFVRAGNFESSDLNKLDTYSFIKSAYSTNKDTSPKGNIGWYNVIQAVHRNGASDGPGYIGQIALGMTINTDDMFFRGKRTDPWKTVIHSGNIGSQSVAYASNADMVDGYHATSNNNKPWGTIPAITPSGFMDIGKHLEFHYDNTTGSDYSTALMCQGNYSNIVYLPTASGTLALTSQVLTWKSQIIDMRNYSESYWHPVTVPLPNLGYNKIKVSVQLNSGDKPSWATHSNGITCNMEIWATASGWGTTDSDTICLNYTYKFCSQNPCGWMQLGSPSLGVVFLRGGSRYTVYTDFDATFTPHNQKYTWSSGGSSQDTGGPHTSCPGLNFNMGAIRADLIATMVQARRVCAGHDPGIDNSISCSNWFRSSGNTGWYNTTYQGGWYMSDTSWIRAHNNVGIYTGGQIYSSSSIRMGNILLEYTDEINNMTSGGLHLNYRSSGIVSLCLGGGNVGIGTTGPAYKLDVNGQVKASGFHHSNHSNDDAVLLAGGGYKTLNSIYGGDINHLVFLGYLNLDHGNDGTVSSSFSCLGYSVPFTYTRGGNYCRITIPDTTYQVFYIRAATASVNYSGGGMDTWVGHHRGSGAWWLHCYASGFNEVRVKGFRQSNSHNDSWWGGNPLWSNNDGANKITVCIFGYVKFR